MLDRLIQKGENMVDATGLLNEIAGGLENMALSVVNLMPDDRTFAEIWGWNQPAVNRHDIALTIRAPAQLIAEIPLDNRAVTDEQYTKLSVIPARISYMIGNVLPNLPGGNAAAAYATIKSLIDHIIATIKPLAPGEIDFENIESRDILPVHQARRLREIERAINKITNDTIGLEAKIQVINGAHATAEALPADLSMLQDARRQVSDAVKASQINVAGSETARATADATTKEIENLKSQAVKLVENTGAAFSAATTKGLGEEFGNRAASLSGDVWKLGVILAVTLIIGGIITYFRLDHINELISSKNFSLQVLWAHVILSVVSVAAPVWFAWLITKQIGQRFRLSEDYAFKASVAKAYAGYSQEAARIDPEFQKKLYSTALARIDEEPLRHVETDNHGSPFHEFLSKRRNKNNPKHATDDINNDMQ